GPAAVYQCLRIRGRPGVGTRRAGFYGPGARCVGGGAERAAGRRPDERSEPVPHPLDLVAVLLQLPQARTPLREQLADEDEAPEMEQELVYLAELRLEPGRVHQAASSASSSTSTGTSWAVGAFGPIRRNETIAPTAATAASA